jgi:hypothetical protein
MKKSGLIVAIQKEILRHEFSTFVDEPLVASKGGKGVVNDRAIHSFQLA